ncbi:STAM-binding protein-like A [Trichonephila inaurata madagascariensis]|uniref:STAM-binding protein-like A n=3 Tax=Trichonephila inaurata madagascariensis TaxID=2747483 RepID=A0A8X6YG04_9ARAC|nr:STAM-binding protein-like A [Trichonephila inaurata madagascariensis]
MAPESTVSTMKNPQSYVRSLAQVASAVTVDKRIPIRRYFRSGSEMLRMAKMYLDEGQLENAYILYTKYTTLFIEQIPRHPEYSTLSDAEKMETRKNLESIFSIAEKVKSNLVVNYTKKYEKWKEEKEREEAEERVRQLQMLEEQQNKLKELKLKEDFEKEKNWRLAQGREMLKNMESVYPESIHQIDSYASDDDVNQRNLSTYSPSPTFNPEQSIQAIENRAISMPSFDRSTKPRSLLSPGPDSAYVHGLRLVIVPLRGIDTFLGLAKQNTDRNIETCGILTGKMSHNQLMITHLLIPKQTGTSDSCTTDNEEDIFIYQDKHDLITLGWIHTHPSQTAFMSSVDLHTHCSYQLMMPEAIAIVCAPKYEKTSIFSLTSNYGLDYISQCQQKGFHPHPNEPTIYEESVHVKLDNHANVTVVDLRK